MKVDYYKQEIEDIDKMKGYKPVDEFNKSILMGRGVYFD